MTNFYYLDLSLKFEKDYDEEVIPVYFKKNIIEAVNELFGEVGSTVSIDVLKFNHIDKRGILRVPNSQYVKLRSSLTLSARHETNICRYIIHKASPSLLALQADSREYRH
ncbi:ribonuclease P protein subunit p14-like [Leptinotarsa decemlineata]|uniref:ribonuclease P protein subunit p14-like n=1 Tax=Leptinotarsa decemlineata TaxID=7539 RepID=UPI003D3053B9